MLIEKDDRRWWPLVVSVGASVLSGVLAVGITLGVQQRSDQRDRDAREGQRQQICALVVALDDNYHSAPPTSEVGRRNAASLAQIRVALGCPDDHQ